jgi:ATP-binding cassette subfamily B protein IrtA
LKNLLGFAVGYKKELRLAILFILLGVIAGIFPYFIAHKLIVDFIDKPALPLNKIIYSGILIAVFLILKSVLNAVGITFSHKAAYGTLYEMRRKFSDKTASMPLGDITDKGSGFYKKKIIDDIGNLEVAIAHIFVEGIPNIIIPLIVLIIIFINDWRMGLLSLGSLPISLFAMSSMMKTGMAKLPKYYEAQSKLNNTIIEYVSGMDVVKVFGQTTASYEKYAQDVKNYEEYAYKWTSNAWLPMSVVGVVLPCTIVLTLPIGLLLYMNGALSLATWVFTLLMNLAIGIPFNKALMFLPTIPNLSYAVTELVKSFEAPDVATGQDASTPARADVCFEHVSFAYDEVDVLKDISFTAKENSLTAIVGPSGSGKSTIAKLLVHYWDVKSGKVKVGGKDIRDYTADALMDTVSFVSQDIFLFDDSIMENIRIGNPDASDEEVYAVSKAAACHEFVSLLPEGYQTRVGTDGGKLSGGERQRITIARAMLKNSPVVVLDEAMCYIDAENEDVIQVAINNLIARKTVIVIAHRLSSIAGADQILVLDKGELIAQGKHEDLIQDCTLYQKLWAASEETVNWELEV